ncbi:cell envelope integrity protein CreD [Litorimonas sp. WD9-15]|uniref:cell envelope integrity protein CreD n=1 Tax=Litorimonas sp. WD9-15 TaxID=3418716 RepID=UPI003D000466
MTQEIEQNQRQDNVLARFRGSAGLKLILICFLVLLMGIPAMFIGAISYERSSYADQVFREVSERYGGEQTLVGPILSVPYQIPSRNNQPAETGHYILFPDQGRVDFTSIDVETKQQSLYKVPVYNASGTMEAEFSNVLSRLTASGLDLDLTRAKLLVSVSDVRGLKSDVSMMGPDGQRLNFEPAQFNGVTTPAIPPVTETALNGSIRVISPAVPGSNYRGMPRFGNWLSADIGEWVESDVPFEVSTDLSLSGAQSLSVLPFAKSTRVDMASNWADPGFQGEFTPLSRDIGESGFSANWTLPYLSRGVAGEGRAHVILNRLAQNQVRVKFVNTDNPYQTVNRALKYSILFIGMVFLAYFLFEVIVGVRVHPAQYILIGLAQAIFYLLLLAFSERLGFSPAFAIASALTVIITSGYAGAVFGGRDYIWKAGAVFATVYGLLFVLMKIEDFALMIGALASFITIAAMMYLTRNMEWYGVQRLQSIP